MPCARRDLTVVQGESARSSQLAGAPSQPSRSTQQEGHSSTGMACPCFGAPRAAWASHHGVVHHARLEDGAIGGVPALKYPKLVLRVGKQVACAAQKPVRRRRAREACRGECDSDWAARQEEQQQQQGARQQRRGGGERGRVHPGAAVRRCGRRFLPGDYGSPRLMSP